MSARNGEYRRVPAKSPAEGHVQAVGSDVVSVDHRSPAAAPPLGASAPGYRYPVRPASRLPEDLEARRKRERDSLLARGRSWLLGFACGLLGGPEDQRDRRRSDRAEQGH